MSGNTGYAFAKFENKGWCGVIPCVIPRNPSGPLWVSSEHIYQSGSTTVPLGVPGEGPDFSEPGQTFSLGYKIIGGNEDNTTWDSQDVYTWNGAEGNYATIACQFTGTTLSGSCSPAYN